MDEREWLGRHFLDKTRELFELVYDDCESGSELCPYKEVYDRLQTYLSCFGQEHIGIREFLEQDHYDTQEIEFFLQKCAEQQAGEETAGFSKSERWERFLAYSLNDTLELFQRVLHNDPEDPHCSAITTVYCLEDYLFCNPSCTVSSPRELLYTYGHTKEEVDSLYEQYRRECVIWRTVSGHPIPPLQTFGRLSVYQVEEKFVVVLPTERRNLEHSAGAEFDADRRCIWTKNLNLTEAEEILSRSRPGAKKSDFSEPFHRFDFGKHIAVSLYLTPDAYLYCVVSEGGVWKDTKSFDLLS